MSATDLTDLTIAGASELIDRGALSPVDLTQACLDRIEKLDGKVNAVLRTMPERALAAARAAEAEIQAGRRRGPLHGVPYGLKDIIDIAGDPTTAHSKVLAQQPPVTTNAAVTDRLEAAVQKVLADGVRTGDLMQAGDTKPVSTSEMGDAILAALDASL